MVMTPVTWLHISDFHFRAEGDKFSQEQAAQSLLESVRAELGRVQQDPSFAVVTGDVAFSGQNAEYLEARAFLDKLVEATDIDPGNFYFVPGNHDVDRNLHELAYLGGNSHINSPQLVDYYLADPNRIAPLIERQAEFWSFVEDFTAGQQRITTSDGLGYVAKLDINRLIICLLGLNSAWLSGADGEEMTLVIGERHVINAIDAARALNPHFIIALAHHPVEWLTEWDAASCRSRLLPAADLYLRGHLHAHQVALSSSPAEPCIEIAAGSGHATRFYENSYNIASIDPRTGTCRIQHYRFLPANAQFETAEPMTARVAVRGSIPGSSAAVVEAISSEVPHAAPFGDFMAGLLTDQIGEIPVLMAGTVSFVVPSAAKEFVDEESLASVVEFLGLRNLLRLYEATVPLKTRIAEHASVILDYAASLGAMTLADPDCVSRLQGDQQTTGTAGNEDAGRRWSLSLLDDIRRSGDWAELESHAWNLVDSSDATTRREARAALAEALMHSDEAQKREKAFSIASELASAADASDHEIVLAAATAEVRGDDAEATSIVVSALEAGRRGRELVDYARMLSARVGSRDLRELADRASSAAPEGGVR